MPSNRELTKRVAAYKQKAQGLFEDVLTALLALAWRYKDSIEGEFRFDADPDLYNEALAICIDMTNKASADARAYAQFLIDFDGVDGDAVWDSVYGDDAVGSFDMVGSHLLAMLAIWVTVAIQSGWTEAYTRLTILRYITNPYACPEWRRIPVTALAWGRGYGKDVLSRLIVIGQNLIVAAYRYAEWENERAKGATYYIRRRGSDFYCPACDALCGYPISIDVPWERLHSRCLCFPEYHYDPMP